MRATPQGYRQPIDLVKALRKCKQEQMLERDSRRQALAAGDPVAGAKG